MHSKQRDVWLIPGLGVPFLPEYGYSLHQELPLKRLWTISGELMTKHACLARLYHKQGSLFQHSDVRKAPVPLVGLSA